MKDTIFYGLVLWTAFSLIGCSNDPAQTVQNEPPPAQVTQVVGVAKTEPENRLLTLTAGTSGKLTQVLVQANDVVRKGQLLATVDVALDEAQLRQAQSKIASQRAAIEANRASANAVKVNLEEANRTYELNRKLLEVKAITQQTLNESKATVDKLEQDYEQALANLKQSQSRLHELTADVHYYQTNLRQKQITAPTDGKLLSWDARIGDYVKTDSKLGEFAPSGALIAIAEIDELFADQIDTGLKADISSQANGEKIGTGKIVYAAEYLKKKSLFSDETAVEDRRVREVHIRLDSGARVLTGSKVDATVYLKKP